MTSRYQGPCYNAFHGKDKHVFTVDCRLPENMAEPIWAVEWCRSCQRGNHSHHTDSGEHCINDNAFNADCCCGWQSSPEPAAAPLPGEASKLLGDEQLERLGFLVCETDGDCDFCHTLGVPQADYFWYRTSHEYVEGDYYCRSCATKKVAAWEAEAKTYENWQPSPDAGEPVGK